MIEQILRGTRRSNDHFHEVELVVAFCFNEEISLARGNARHESKEGGIGSLFAASKSPETAVASVDFGVDHTLLFFTGSVEELVRFALVKVDGGLDQVLHFPVMIVLHDELREDNVIGIAIDSLFPHATGAGDKHDHIIIPIGFVIKELGKM